MNDWSSFDHALYYKQMTGLQSEYDLKSRPDLPRHLVVSTLKYGYTNYSIT